MGVFIIPACRTENENGENDEDFLHVGTPSAPVRRAFAPRIPRRRCCTMSVFCPAGAESDREKHALRVSLVPKVGTIPGKVKYKVQFYI